MLISRKYRKGERGQVLILCAICLVVLLLFVGLAIDFGMAYVTKARLEKQSMPLPSREQGIRLRRQVRLWRMRKLNPRPLRKVLLL